MPLSEKCDLNIKKRELDAIGVRYEVERTSKGYTLETYPNQAGYSALGWYEYDEHGMEFH